MSLTEIMTAIETLSDEERAELQAWLSAFPLDDWDRQMIADGKTGKFDQLEAEAEAAFRRGECRPFP